MWTFFLPSSFSDGPVFRGRFFLVDLFSVYHFSVDVFSVDVISVDLFSYNRCYQLDSNLANLEATVKVG